MTDEIKQAVAEALAARDAAEEAKKAERDAIRAEVLAEVKAEPKHKATFNIGGKATGKSSKFAFRASQEELEKYDKAEIEETDKFMYDLMHPTQAPNAMRVLEETEALEGAGLIPVPLLDKIFELRDEVSLVSKIGFQRYQTNSLTLTIPREDAGMAVFATIAEEGAYVANEPAFSAQAITVVKKGSMITATEELLEDSNLFQPYFVGLCGRKMGLTENLILFTELKATATVGLHSATWTAAEIDTFPFFMGEPWIEGSHIIMEPATMGVMRGLLVATPRAYGDFPLFGGREMLSFMGIPVHLNSNWETLGGGDTFLIASHVNPAAVAWVERRGLSIKVDPYGDALNGRIRYFPSFRAACKVIQVLGNVTWTDHA